MKIDKRVLTIIGIIYAVLLIGIVAFYLFNPFNNQCVKGNCLTGYGIYINNSGMKYEGEWKNGLRQGKGTLIYPDVYQYVGEWKNNRMDGYGTMDHGWYKYSGEWKSGNKNGMGTMYFFGNKYVGHWKNNLRHGAGTLTYQGGYQWVGEWKDDNMYEGKGSIIIKSSQIRYDGQIHKGKLFGEIIISYPDGRKFKGEVISGKKYVQGTIIYPDGREHKKTLDNDVFISSWL